MSCDCAARPDIFRLQSYTDPWLLALEERGVKDSGWTTLRRCPICGQHWQIDGYDKYQVGLAMKIADPAAWSTFADQPLRLRYLIEARGGLGAATCIWAGCTRRVLKGSAHCPDHAYEIMGVRA